MITFKDYVRVSSLDEAYELNQKKNNIIIGGMHWIKMGTKAYVTAIDLSGLGLDQIVDTGDALEIGAMVTLRDLELSEELNKLTSDAVRDAVTDIVGVQFRNTATVGGSIAGRYGFSDVLNIFTAMDAEVVLHRGGTVPIEEYAKVGCGTDIVVKLIVKKQPMKVAYEAVRRQRTDIPAIAVSVSNVDGWKAVVSARPERAVVVRDETGILDRGVTIESAAEFGNVVAETCAFGSNMRGSEEYRRMVCSVLVKRALMKIEEA